MDTERDLLKLVVAGHVDHGKSTVIGRLFFDTGSLPQGAVDKVRSIARQTGKDFEFAYLLDAFEEEQKQGITIDTTRLQFHTDKRDYVIIDAPGHTEFLKNMISGAADAEAAFLVVDASRGVEEQSRRHAYMLSLLGIRQICVIVNKMDLTGYSVGVFQRIRTDMDAFLGSLDVPAPAYVPVSALKGENITARSPALPWYTGPSLIQALDSLGKEPRAEQAALRLPIQDVYKFDDRRIIAGRIDSGTLEPGDEIVILPGGKRTTVKAFAAWPESAAKDRASAGESVGIIVEDEFFNHRGEVICLPGQEPAVRQSFKASLFWMGKKELRPGKKYRIKIATQETDAEISRLLSVVDASSLSGESGRASVKLNEVAEVLITTREPVCLDTFAASRSTGRFVLVDGYDVAGGGIITAVEEGRPAGTVFVSGSSSVRCDIFMEYAYSLEEQAVVTGREHVQQYAVGDPIPLSGSSYAYPEFFDLILFREKTAVQIREGQVATLLPLDDYRYAGLPLINEKGFAFRVKTTAAWESCKHEHTLMPPRTDADLSVQWLDFSAYRSIPFMAASWEI